MRAKSRHRRLLVALATVFRLTLAAGLGLYLWLFPGLPGVQGLTSHAAAPSNKVYDRYGRLLYEMPAAYGGSHSPVPLDQVPLYLRQATIAVEDASFYQNPGVDARGILRALWTNLRGGEIRSGGSTITQQLVRNLLLSPEEASEQTLRRKLREAILAWQLTQRYSKDEILELYLNETYYGNMAYGVEAAAQSYFDKHVADLDLAECALLAGLPQSPTSYNPLENLPAARGRQATVLDLMVRQGYISAEQARLAKEEKLYFASAPFSIRAPHFVMYVRNLLEQELGLERLEQGGLSIYTTLDVDLNETARDLARFHLARLADCNGQQDQCPPGGHNVRNAAVVALDPQTGEILAMLGSPDYFSARIDGAVNGATALRQPGSSIKPITYAAAFEQGRLTPATVLYDLRTSFVTREGTPYVPYNYDLQFRGPVRLREALASSYNLIAVKVLDTIGLPAMTGLARRLGITTLDSPDLGLAVTLGGGEVRLLELTAAYAAFANGGRVVHPLAILRVEDASGQVLWQPAAAVGERVLDERVAYLISDILSDDSARIPSFGEGSVLELTRPAAVKTGTTYDFHDNWTVGYTPDLVVGVWTGNADNEAMYEVSGVSGAAPIWHDLMEAALKGRPALDFARPAGLVDVEVCALSGLLPGPDCPHRVQETFLVGTEPTQVCTMHQRIAIDQATGLRATASTPPERIVEKLFTIFPPEAQEWARAQGIPQPPPELDNTASQRVAQAEAGPPLLMTGPDQGAIFRIDPGLPRESQRILVAARPGAGARLAQVTLLVDGRPLATFGGTPYQVFWELEPGLHTFWAEGVDASGQAVRSGEVRIEVRE
jgi:1A family penicillin-binding protein